MLKDIGCIIISVHFQFSLFSIPSIPNEDISSAHQRPSSGKTPRFSLVVSYLGYSLFHLQNQTQLLSNYHELLF